MGSSLYLSGVCLCRSNLLPSSLTQENRCTSLFYFAIVLAIIAIIPTTIAVTLGIIAIVPAVIAITSVSAGAHRAP